LDDIARQESGKWLAENPAGSEEPEEEIPF
jgi:hypothetical protein